VRTRASRLRPRHVRTGSAWLRRRGWVLVVTTALAALSAFAVSDSRPVTHTAEATLIVQSGATRNDPGNANEAATLAVTYSRLIPHDTRIIRYLAGLLGQPADQVQRRITALSDPETSLLRVRYTDTDPYQAVLGTRELAYAVAGVRRVTPAIAPGSVVLVAYPTVAAPSPAAPPGAVPLGALLGLILGAALVVAWERADARVDDRHVLRELTGCPVSLVDGRLRSVVVALLRHWQATAPPNGLGVRIALLPTVAGLEGLLWDLARYFAETAISLGQPLGVEIGVPHDRWVEGPSTTLVLGGVPGDLDAGEAVALACDLTVLVVPAGARQRELRAALDALAHHGIWPGWTVLVPQRGTLRGAVSPDDAPADDPAPLPTPSQVVSQSW
jgi:capsular polysaccharide biosynthesis protein